MNNLDDYIFIGMIGKTKGIKGELFITSYTSFPERFKSMKSLFLTKEGTFPRNYEISSLEYCDKNIVVKLKDINSIEDAKKLIGYKITIKKEERYKAPSDYYYVDDLVGCQVFDKMSGEIGKLKDVIFLSSNDIYVVDYKGQDVLIPAVSEFIENIDIENKKISVVLIDGMLPNEN